MKMIVASKEKESYWSMNLYNQESLDIYYKNSLA